MVYKFILVNDEVDNFSREIQIDPDASFLDLRDAILDSVGYTKDDINSFYICDDDWSRQAEVTLMDMGTSSDTDLWIMEDTPISQLVEDEGQKLMFVFDFLTERAFFIELKDVITGKYLDKAECTSKKGNPPAQKVDLDAFEEKIDARHSELSFDFDDFDIEGFNDDELPEGSEEY